ncbi:MAG: hypothetical protein L0G99_04480 [Propionibacteriales bacterium]|nr:hypothetical protein [Propionibacteriales bacterium]
MLFTPWVGDDQGTISDLMGEEPLASLLLTTMTALVMLPALLSRIEVNDRAVTTLAGVALGAILVLGFLVLSTMSLGSAYACAQAPCRYPDTGEVAIPWAYLAGLTAAVVNVLALTDPPRRTAQEMR